MSSPVEPVRIVVTYPDGALPSQAFQAVQRTRRSLRRAGYLARVELLPRSATRDGGAGVGGVEIEADADLGRALDEVVARLAEEGRLRRGPEPPRTIAVHRGAQPVGERARVTE